MTCWLKYLQDVADILKNLEPDISRRKRLSIDVLRELEEEKGHDADVIGQVIKDEGVVGIIKRASRKMKKKRKGAEEVLDELEEAAVRKEPE